MSRHLNESRIAWLAVGVVAGLCLSYFWPHEPALAVTNDRNSKFGMGTVAVKDLTIAGVRDTLDAVFVLDYLTGTLKGAVMNRSSGQFTNFYGRSLAQDFNVRGKSEPHYAFVSGNVGLPSGGGTTMATGVLYVGELSSGRVIAYGFPFRETNSPLPPMNLRPMDSFQFREPSR